MKAPRRYWLGIVDDISQRERIVVTDANVLINLIQVDRLDLLGALPGLGFIVPYEVESEIVVPAQSQALAGAIGAGDAVGRRQGSSTTGRQVRPARPARVSSIRSMWSRNFRNMIQVSIGRRSRSPFTPLSLRMIRRADLMMRSSRCAVVSGLAVPRLRMVKVATTPSRA